MQGPARRSAGSRAAAAPRRTSRDLRSMTTDHRRAAQRLPAPRGQGGRPQLRRASGLRDADPPRAHVEGGDRSRSHGTSRSAAGASGQRCSVCAYWRTRGGRVVSSRRRRTASATTRARSSPSTTFGTSIFLTNKVSSGCELRWRLRAPPKRAVAAHRWGGRPPPRRRDGDAREACAGR